MPDYIRPEDYEEPTCLLDMGDGGEAPADRIPVRRIIGKLDEYLQKSDYPAAERHLNYWLAEARQGRDRAGELALINELMGMYRNADRRKEGIAAAERGLELTKSMGEEESVTGATTFLNAATVFKAFGMAERAVPLYEKAKVIYESKLDGNEYKLGGLYNNMALALVDVKRFSEAYALYAKAMEVMKNCPDCEAEQAVTCLNEANAVEAELGLDEGAGRIDELLDEAEKLLDTPSLMKTGYYAYYCGRCAPTFDYYGRFAYAQTLRERAKK